MQTVTKNTIMFPLDKLKPYITEETILACSPGRINMIGEHTDYNNGFVLPAAIDKSAYILLTPRKDENINLYAVDLDKKYSTNINSIHKTGEWTDYLLGVAAQFVQKGFQLKGFDAALTADVPVGSGLSSSAAVECAMAFGLNELINAGKDKLSLVKLAQKAEHEFPGVQCGIMDQFASVFGKADHLIKLDCKTLDYEYIPLNINGYAIVLFDTNVKHSLAATAYNERREQCAAGVDIVRKHIPSVTSLRDVTLAMLEEFVLPADALIYRRCRYVMDENNRVLKGCEYLKQNDLADFGRLMFRSHEGLSKEYEVSCAELDFLVDEVKDKDYVLGARMMGGGFGGCTINLIKEDKVTDLIKELTEAYEKEMKRELSAYKVSTGNGTTLMTNVQNSYPSHL